MTDNRVLSDEQRDSIEKRAHILYSQGDKKLVESAISDTEQAVLQSPQVQKWRKDAERYRWLRNDSLDIYFGHDVLAPVVFNADDAFNHGDDALVGDSLDKAVDAAMEKEK
jgi:hypothetical protein